MNTLRGETVAARNAAKTHCIRGHELTGDNAYYKSDGTDRNCRACRRETCIERSRTYYAKNKDRINKRRASISQEKRDHINLLRRLNRRRKNRELLEAGGDTRKRPGPRRPT